MTKFTKQAAFDTGIGEGVGRLPNFLIVGVQKGGTTSLAIHLRSHPQAFVPEKKELRFFDMHYGKGLEWYQEQFRDAGEAIAVGEATPNYMFDETVRGRMASVLPEARLIAILRDPVARAYSHYWHNRRRGLEPLGFSDALDAEGERRAEGDLRTRLRYAYVERGRYFKQLKALARLYPREALHIVILDDFKEAPTEIYQGVLRFLGLNESILPQDLGVPQNAFYGFRSQRLRHLGRRLPERLGNLVARVNRRPGPYPPMDAFDRKRLGEVYSDDNAKLASWLGRSLEKWQS